MNTEPQEGQPAKASKPDRSWTIFASLAAVSLALLIGILAIQIAEYMYYRAHPSAWTAAAGGGPLPRMEPQKEVQPRQEFKVESLLSDIKAETAAVSTAETSEAQAVIPAAAAALEESEASASPAAAGSDLSVDVAIPAPPEPAGPEGATPAETTPAASDADSASPASTPAGGESGSDTGSPPAEASPTPPGTDPAPADEAQAPE